jgi:transglutaminase-like putative cysteine protease
VRISNRVWLELAAFTALAWYTAGHWTSGLMADAQGERVFACILVAAAVAVALTLSAELRGARGLLLRIGCVLGGLGAGFVAAGLDRRFLAPAHWDELGDGIDRGFAALGSVQWPYDGPEPWAGLILMLAVPLVLASAAALAFWPRMSLRPFALVLLVALYGVAVTEHEFDGELGRGVVLLLLTAAWLWLPRMPERGWSTAVAAGGVVLVACVAALPAAARYEDRRPLVDYESWNPFEAQAATHFDWSHSYGPIDWPRDGTTLMNVRSNERNYWKVETLDRFEGERWERSGFGRGNNPLLPSPYKVFWETDLAVTIRDLDTSLFPIAGTALQIRGADPVIVPSEDGTLEALGESLDEGDSYQVEAYVPEPTPGQMRAGATDVPFALASYTQVGPLPEAYEPVERLARRLAEGQPTRYDIVRSVQRHLREEYTYGERPPRREFPLPAFLFRDRIGYCQHFSGAMALMLRMLGIPVRVAAGFTPGSYNADTKEYRVRDLDAHSWVEVWWSDIGWVPFDPTPSVAPADSQSGAEAASASGGSTNAGEVQDGRGAQDPAASDGGGSESTSPDSPIATWVPIAAIILLGAGILVFLRLRTLVRRREAVRDDIDIARLRRALARTGEQASPRLTLRQLEARLEDRAGPAAARYVRMLRERRFAPLGGQAPDAAARRDLRRALGHGRGLRTRLGALAALPPVPFRRD